MQRFSLRSTVLFLALAACGDDDGYGDDDPRDDASAPTDRDASMDGSRPDRDSAIMGDASSGDGSTPGGGDASLGTDAGLDAAAPDGGGDGGLLDSGGDTFATLYSALIQTRCAGCHGDSHPSGLRMPNAATAYDNLINVAGGANGSGSACEDEALDRVEPGNPENSLLLRKLQPNPPCGQRMPASGPPLSAAEITRVANWIAAGAPE